MKTDRLNADLAYCRDSVALVVCDQVVGVLGGPAVSNPLANRHTQPRSVLGVIRPPIRQRKRYRCPVGQLMPTRYPSPAGITATVFGPWSRTL